MSRIGKQPVKIPDGVKVAFKKNVFHVESKQGKLEQWIDPAVNVKIDDGAKEVLFSMANNQRRTRALWGLYRVLVNNMVTGLTTGFSKSLSIVGVGYNAKLQGKKVVLQIGFCHPVEMDIPNGLSVEISNPTSIKVMGADKHAVGQFAANIRAIRPPEPYKGKGIRYVDEQVQRKERKSLGA